MHMTDSYITEAPEEWVEANLLIDPPKATPVRALSANMKIDADPNRPICRCWRCGGGNIAVSEMGPADRIVARHLLRMSEKEREDWLWHWVSNPSHGSEGERALRAWLAIAQGKKVSQPVYAARGRR